MLVVDNIKIKYSQEGYLPNYPPHLISDEEMCEAFLVNEFSYFKDMYPLVDENLKSEYELLINAFKYHIVRFLTKVEEFYSELPNWVYSYMLGQVVTNMSEQEDRHYFLAGIHSDNIEDILTIESQQQCYKYSKRYVNKLDKSERFVYLDEILNGFSDSEKSTIQSEFDKWGVVFSEYGELMIRPPSMFGEQNIIKMIRLHSR